MRLTYLSSTAVSYLFLLVLAWRSWVRGQPCPPGQITHIDDDRVRCCLPADCEPNHYLTYCEKNGTKDTCAKCPKLFGLYKRTSSFAVEPCHRLLIQHLGDQKCKVIQLIEGNGEAALEDMKNCFCELEGGQYYRHPEILIGESSNCQYTSDYCSHGFQPTHKGECEPCPPNTVQDTNRFRLCRPQKNCTALRLETKTHGNATKEAVCAKPPPLPPVTTVFPPVPKSSPGTSAPLPSTILPDGSTRNLLNSESDAPKIVVVAVVCSVLIICCVFLVYLGHRKGWKICIWRGKCYQQDMERPVGSQLPMSGQDNDNSSDNSCYTCTDSCLTSSSKNNSGGAAAKSGTGACDPSKASRPLPSLEAYMNMNMKCPQSLPDGNGSLSEPLYNSIGHDERMKVNADNLPSYKNTNGFAPSALKQEWHNYPNRVRLTSTDEEDSSMKGPCYAQVQQRAPARRNGRRDHQEDFSETDPLLTNSENCSSGVPTPVGTPALRSILRNGNSRQDPTSRVGETQAAGVGGAGGGGEGGAGAEDSAGNRPHLSMLLNVTEDTSHLVTEEEDPQVANLPYLSQLVSGQGSVQQGPGAQPRPPVVQHQQLLQQHAPPLPPPQQQQHGQELLPGRAPQGSPLAARLIPVSSAATQPLNPSLVQMEELKPVLPLSPGPSPGAVVLSPSSSAGDTGAGQGDKGRSVSPARISPTQQEMRTATSPKTVAQQRPVLNQGVLPSSAAADPASSGGDVKDVNDGKTSSAKHDRMATETVTPGTAKELNEDTFRKQVELDASSPCEDTMQKSVCRSSGLGDSLEFSSPLDLPSEEDAGRSRTMYRRSNSEASRSLSPTVHQLPPSRSISTPEEKHRPFAVVKPMQSDQSLNAISDSQDHLAGLTQQLDYAGRQFPLNSLAGRSPGRQFSQTSSEDGEQTRPKTPDHLSEEEDSEGAGGGRETESERTSASFYGDNDRESAEEADGQGKGSDRSSEK